MFERSNVVGIWIGTLGAAALVAGSVAFPAVTPSAQAATVSVTSASQLKTALAGAKAGMTISLADGTYTGKWVASAAGTASAPITLVGSRKAILTTGSTGSGYALNVKGSYWNLTGFSVTKAAKGIVLDNSDYSIIDGVDVGNIGQEAVHMRTSSTNVTIRNSLVHDTGITTKAYGEGIYVGSANSNWSSVMGSSSKPDQSNNVLIEKNTITNTSAEGIDIKEGTTGGRVIGNVFKNSGYSGENSADSWVDVKGNGYVISGNSGSGTRLDAFQVHSVLSGWGGTNTFSGNSVTSVPGYEVNIASKTAGNVVRCKSSAAGMGLTNVTCKP